MCGFPDRIGRNTNSVYCFDTVSESTGTQCASIKNVKDAYSGPPSDIEIRDDKTVIINQPTAPPLLRAIREQYDKGEIDEQAYKRVLDGDKIVIDSIDSYHRGWYVNGRHPITNQSNFKGDELKETFFQRTYVFTAHRGMLSGNTYFLWMDETGGDAILHKVWAVGTMAATYVYFGSCRVFP